MNSWNVLPDKEDERKFYLANDVGTVVRLSKRVDVDLPLLMSRLEERGIPIAYSYGVHEIYFTVLPGDDEDKYAVKYGDYDRVEKRITLSCGVQARPDLHSSLVHELIHHVDMNEDFSSREKIVEEKALKARGLDDGYASVNVDEYVAVGFEMHYFGTREQRRKIRKEHPRLYNLIRYIHRKYSKR